MIWMDPAQSFSRPLRWIIAQHGGQPIPMELFGVHAANHSEGHRILGAGRVDVGSFDDFIAKLEQNFVIVSQEERRAKIERELNEEVHKLNGRIIGDDRLLEEVVYINEFPTIVRGKFEERFLELPREILITVMKEHQKYFAVENESGELLPYFLAVMNTASDPKGFIRKGHERVLRARLTDALFFWEVDRKQTLEERRPRLKSIVFQEKLGTYADKVKRVARLARKINTLTKAKVDKTALETRYSGAKAISLRTWFASLPTCRELSAACMQSTKAHPKKSGVRFTINIALRDWMTGRRRPNPGPFYPLQTNSTRCSDAFPWD